MKPISIMDAEWHPVEDERTKRARAYIEKVERRMARRAERSDRKWQRFADDLWNVALGAGLAFFIFAVLVSI